MAGELEGVQKALRELGKSFKSLPKDSAPKAIHKLRTATRRVEAIAVALLPADGKESRRFLKSIESIRKASGGVRDMDVLACNARKLARHSAGDSLTRLIGHLEDARQQYVHELLRALGRRHKIVRDNLKEYAELVRSALTPPKSASRNGRSGQTREGVHAAAMNAARELGEWPPLDASNIHAFRLKVKALRYLLQLDAEADPVLLGFVAALGEVQRRIGDWHDWQQLDEIAREILDPKLDGALLTRIDQTAKRRLNQALASANGLRGRYLAMPIAAGI